MTLYFGTADKDQLSSFNWNSGWDFFFMGAGNDSVVAPITSKGLFFFGEGGNDFFSGSNGADNAFGGIGDDTLFGNGGNDLLAGESGSDLLVGGTGDDLLIGGAGTDYLSGGQGSDTFVFDAGSSPANQRQADTIIDWDLADYIDSSVKGTSSNYVEFWVSATNVDKLRNDLDISPYKTKDHAFCYNKDTNTGYLFSDLDNNNTFETAVIIEGAGFANALNWSDII